MPIVISLFAFTLPMLSLVFIVIYQRCNNRSAICAILFGLTMASIFYGYKADIGADIYRHVVWLEFYKEIPLSQCFNAGHYTNLFIWDIWCWIIARFNNPLLLQASGAFVTYSLASYMIFDSYRRSEHQRRSLLLMLFFMFSLLRTRDIVLGIRSAAAYTLLAFASYRLFVQKKNIIPSLILATFACLIHVSAFQFALLLLFMPLMKKNEKKSMIVLFVASLSIGLVSNLLLTYIPNDGTVITTLLRSGLLQAIDTAELNHKLSFNSWLNKWWEVGVCVLMCMRVFTFDKVFTRTQQNSEIVERNGWGYALMCFAINLGYCISLQQNGDRMLTINEVAMLPYFYYSFTVCPMLRDKRFIIVDVLLGIGICGLLLLHIYSLIWGSASTSSLVEGVLFGVLPAL